MTYSDVTAQQVFDRLWEHTQSRASVDASGLSVSSAEVDGWVLLARRDDEWVALGHLGPVGDTSTPVFETVLRRRREVEVLLSAAAGNDIDPAADLGWDLIAAIRTFEREVRLRPLTDAMPTLTFDSFGGSVPMQAEGTLAGYSFYFRHRGGWASLSVGGQDCIGSPLWLAGMNHGDRYDSGMDDDQFIATFTTLVNALAPAPFLWRFEGACRATSRLHTAAIGSPTSLHGRGHTPQEAWKAATEYPEDMPFTVGEWLDYIDGLGLDRRPVNVDTRVFPATTPNWYAPTQP